MVSGSLDLSTVGSLDLGGGGGGEENITGPTLVVGASDSLDNDRADYQCSGAADEADINTAMGALPAAGGRVVLLEGSYTLADQIVFPANFIVLQGHGRATFIDGDALLTTKHAIVLSGYTDCVIKDLAIQTQDGGGKTCYCIIIGDLSHRFVIDNVTIVESDDAGIMVDAATSAYNGQIVNCIILGADGMGIYNSRGAFNILIHGNIITACATYGIYLYRGTYGIITSNHVYSTTGGGIGARVNNGVLTISDNICWSNDNSGIYMRDCDLGVLSDNVCYRNDQHGIYIFSCAGVEITGNACHYNDWFDTATYDGIYLDSDSAANLVVGNQCTLNDRNGIQSDGDRNSILSNYCASNGDYGIEIGATADANRVKFNYFYNNTVGVFLDGGTNTELEYESFQFIKELVGAYLTASPTGIEIDANTEGAIAQGHIPVGIQQVVRIRVWAVALDTPIGAGGQMHAEFTFNAGAPNAAYNTAGKSWALANHDSEEADYVANDVVTWIIEDGDVGNELAALVAKDKFELIVTHEAGADPDGATDAVFGSFTIEYV